MVVGSFRRVFLILLGLALLAGCNAVSNNPRQLMSITISPNSATANNGPVVFTATGTFSSAPVTVTPLAASWSISGPGIDPTCGNDCQYQLTQGTFTAHCGPIGGVDTITAQAPADPNAPPTGSIANTKMVSATATLNCP